LIEIALTLGVLSFGFLATFGLIPVGMGTYRQAMDTSIGSQIVQRVLNDAKQTDFNTLISSGTSSTPSFRYFDNQGDEVTPIPPSTVVPVTAVYEVNTRITGSTTVPMSSGTTSSTNTFPTLATVTVQITNNPGHQTLTMAGNLWNDPRFYISTYSGMVAESNNQ
jgi:uncharacterized protein (TIGR02598 family)